MHVSQSCPPGSTVTDDPPPDAVALLRTLVGFDTTSRNSNLGLIDWAAGLARDAGARIRLTHDSDRRKANLLASFGPDEPGGIVLSGHTDVVPVDDQDWNSDPFTLTARHGRLYGRGTSDMKGFLACCLALVRTWADTELRRPVHLALSYDEETGCRGVPTLIDDLTRHVPTPAFAIIGEPTGLRVGLGHRGYLGFRTTFIGRAAHSSDPGRGENAITAAARFIRSLDDLDAGFAHGTDRTTISVNRIDGGTALNIVPERCAVDWEIRPAANADLTALRRVHSELLRDRAGLSRAPITTEVLTIPPLNPDRAGAAVAAARAFGAAPGACDLPFGTEAGLFQAAGIPSVVCGPGSIHQAHTTDEWIALDQIEDGVRFLENVTTWAEASR
jgi:acetylornithine deacetylase